jgi:hypothetical protein
LDFPDTIPKLSLKIHLSNIYYQLFSMFIEYLERLNLWVSYESIGDAVSGHQQALMGDNEFFKITFY